MIKVLPGYHRFTLLIKMNSFHSTLCIVLLMCFYNEVKCSSSEANLSPDSKSLYHDIVNGHGLYKGFTKVTELGGSNFKSIVFGADKHKLWLIEFYNSWCGHCHRFAPVWKTYASTVHEWRDTVGVGAVDCANDANNQLCRDMEVMYYPMIKLYPPNSDEKFLGEDFSKGTVEEMLKTLVLKLKSLHKSTGNVSGVVNLKPASDKSLETLWTEYHDPDVKYLVLVFEPTDLEVGSELALDLSGTKEVRVRLISPTNKELSQIVGIETGVVVVERDFKFTDLKVHNLTRVVANKEVRKYLVSKGIDIALELPEPEDVNMGMEVDISQVMEVMQMEEQIKKKLQTRALANHVFQMDLETALRYLLNNEIPLHKNITEKRMQALKGMMTVLIKYFPWGHQGKNFLKKLKEKGVDGKEEVDGHTFRDIVRELEGRYKPFMSNLTYIECRGSQPGYRRYPCGLWKLFHTLTVHEKTIDRGLPGEGPEVPFAMAAYIDKFFSCSECRDHFMQMAKSMRGNITTHDDSIMWLWAAHNKVNHRLAGDATEDPKHPKVQFPSAEGCPTCQTSDGSWNYTEVKSFLMSMYGNIIYLGAEDLTPSTTQATSGGVSSSYDKSLRNELYNDEKGYFNKQLNDKRSSWDFNVFDISLCVVLYVCSVAILILVCIKFIFKRSYRKKPYVHDVLSKV